MAMVIMMLFTQKENASMLTCLIAVHAYYPAIFYGACAQKMPRRCAQSPAAMYAPCKKSSLFEAPRCSRADSRREDAMTGKPEVRPRAIEVPRQVYLS